MAKVVIISPQEQSSEISFVWNPMSQTQTEKQP